jgi:hypothetical protein
MNRQTRLVIAGSALLLLVAGTALAAQAPRQAERETVVADEPETPATAEELAHAVERLSAHGIEATTEQLSALAADHGLGGAIRLLAWADETGMSVDEIAAMRVGDADTAPMGWARSPRILGFIPALEALWATAVATAATLLLARSSPSVGRPKLHPRFGLHAIARPEQAPARPSR